MLSRNWRRVGACDVGLSVGFHDGFPEADLNRWPLEHRPGSGLDMCNVSGAPALVHGTALQGAGREDALGRSYNTAVGNTAVGDTLVPQENCFGPSEAHVAVRSTVGAFR